VITINWWRPQKRVFHEYFLSYLLARRAEVPQSVNTSASLGCSSIPHREQLSKSLRSCGGRNAVKITQFSMQTAWVCIETTFCSIGRSSYPIKPVDGRCSLANGLTSKVLDNIKAYLADRTCSGASRTADANGCCFPSSARLKSRTSGARARRVRCSTGSVGPHPRPSRLASRRDTGSRAATARRRRASTRPARSPRPLVRRA
jgi:hypothetical protein